LLAHGAGTNQDHPSMVGLRLGLSEAGYTVMTFNYPYTERGSKRPDPAGRLIECHLGAAKDLDERVDRMFLAGRSMGGRIGTHVVADGFPVAGLVLYAYPLHPAGKPENLRIAQFAEIDVAMLFLQGTRDALSRMDLFETHIASLPNAHVELLEGAGHGFRGGGWDLESIIARYVSATDSWIEGFSSGRRSAQTP
jgi:predicted alpha/beta-hydrolase family hydrolase